MNILLAVDGSPYTAKAVRYITAHLNWFHGNPELHLLHVKAPIPLGHARAAVGREAVEAYYKDEATAVLAPAEKMLRESGIPYQSAYKVGDVADEIKAYCEKHHMDMIVMGSHGHGALTNLVMGSVTTKVLAITSVPVLIVR
jgi:nucleotide-binding universal stress UspA family protein